MGLFDSIIAGVKEHSGLGGNKAGGLVAALLGIIADPKGGGFSGFLDKFRNAGMGDLVSSWISTGDNTPLSGAQVETALGSGAIDSISKQSGIDRATAAGALGGVIPGVIDALTPDGVEPDEQTLLSKVGGFLSDWGGAIGGVVTGGVGAATAMAGGAADKVGDVAGAVGSGVSGTVGRGVDAISGGKSGGSFFKWLLPLLILLGLIALGFWSCGGPGTPAGNVNLNANAAKTNTNANNAPANANVANTNANAAAKSLTEVTLPNGTKLKAFPGGIEDELIKFIQSDEYKNGTNDQLKDKWFSFDDLNFVFGKTDLTPESQRQLDNMVAILKAFPDAKIKIGGYTDKKGDDAANLKLSETRAKAVQAALQKAGVGAQVPEVEGYGEKFATADENASDDLRKADRKTAIRLIK